MRNGNKTIFMLHLNEWKSTAAGKCWKDDFKCNLYVKQTKKNCQHLNTVLLFSKSAEIKKVFDD